MPSVEYFAAWWKASTVWLEGNEHYQKRSWRNKTCISSPTNPLVLTVPLQKGKHQQMPIQQVTVAYEENWTSKHMHSLQTTYGKTAFGEEILDGIQQILSQQPAQLWNLNTAILCFILEMLPALKPYKITSSYIKNYPAGSHDMRKGIACCLAINGETYPAYAQVQRIGKSFQPNLSILDALCHLGPDTIDYLAKYAKYDSTA